MKILMVLTSHDKLGNTGRNTGFWLEELAAPYYVFKDAARPTSPVGSRRMLTNAQLDRTARLDGVKQEDYDTVFCTGGHGPMWDLAEDENSIKLVESFLAAGKTFALVCHSPGALCHVKTPDGKPLVQGKRVTGLTNTEEEEVGLTTVVPFLVEDELKAKDGIFSKAVDWQPYVLTDGLLITGQNPASSGPGAKALVEVMNRMAK